MCLHVKKFSFNIQKDILQISNFVCVCVCVCAQKLEFVSSKGFFEVRFGERPPFELFLKDSDCDEPLWSATIREGNQWTQLE